MSNPASQTTQPRKQQAKAIAAVGLGAVLVCVLLFDQGATDSGDAPATDASGPPTPIQPVLPTASSALTQAQQPLLTTIEPDDAIPARSLANPIDIDQIIAQNPFASPAMPANNTPASPEVYDAIGLLTSTADGSVEDNASQYQSEESQPVVQAVVTGAGRSAVLINDEMYFERDIVDERWQIVSITADEVLLRTAPDQIQ